MSENPNPYEEKQERRRERLEARADRLRTEAARREGGAQAIADMIPLGQPLLVNHHSYKADRNRRDRMRRGFEAAHELRKEADEAARKAAAVGANGAISSDDPEAVEKLGDKAQGLEAKRDRMKAINAAYRKAKGEPAERLIALWKDGVITDKEATDHARTFVLMPYHKVPYPSYALTNIGARIRQAKARAEHLERQAETPPRPPFEGPGFVAEEDRDENRIVVTFPSKPAQVVIDVLKRNGFRWTPSRVAWTRQLSNHGWAAVEWITREIAPAAHTGRLQWPRRNG